MLHRQLKGVLAVGLMVGLLVSCGPKAQVGSGSPSSSDASSGSGSATGSASSADNGSASSGGAGSASSQGPMFTFTRENFPILDGSTSAVPLAEAVCAVLLGESREEVADLVNFSRTTAAYWALMYGEAQLLLAAEAEQTVLEELQEEGHWLMTPFATDALAFVVNQDNPVDNLTIQQVQKIYTGEITNWSQVGGQDLDIIPFQRNAEAGSQTLLKKLVMKDLTLMDPPTTWVSESMGGLMDAIRSYDDSPGAIGFTVYYYAHDMEMARGLKVLSIDGVDPSAQSIREGKYPFLNPYYVVIDEDAEADSPTRVLYEWILGSEGQKLVDQEGYVAILDQEGK